eukprot:g11775.t1 g11775   contig6:568758-569138(-)
MFLRRSIPTLRTNVLHHQQRCMSVIKLSDNDAVDKFRTINQKSVMYFTASWCPPCKMISPIYDKLAEKYTSVAFGKVDVDDNQDAAMEFQISAVPTFVLSKGAEAVNKFSGADQVQLEKLIKDLDA